MYEYYKGFVIREGTERISGDLLRSLYTEIGWCGTSLPIWQNEKFEIALHNSAWAYSVWDGEKLVGYVRIVSDKIMVASIHDLMVKKEFRKQGIGKKLIQLCLQKLPHGNWSAKTTTENYKFYEDCGFSMPDQQNSTMEYDGFIKAKLEGNR